MHDNGIVKLHQLSITTWTKHDELGIMHCLPYRSGLHNGRLVDYIHGPTDVDSKLSNRQLWGKRALSTIVSTLFY